MEFSALELSEFLQGILEGNPDVKVRKPAKIEEGEEGDVCFLSNPKYVKYAYTTKASVLIISESLVFDQPVNPSLIRVKDVYTSFSKILDQYKTMNSTLSNGVEKLSHISASATVGVNVHVGAFSFVGENSSIGINSQIMANVYIGNNVHIGENAIICPGVCILDDCKIGNNCLINGGAVIGSEGFGFAPQEDGTYKKVPQTGNVVIEDNVEIGANTTIDRATLGSTIIRKGAKLDNLIQIAHNVDIGENTVIAAQSGISGSTKIGRNCIVGGQVGIVGHLVIADGTRINAQSGIAKSIKQSGQAFTGSPAFEYNLAMRSQVVFKKLPELMHRISELEQRLKAIEKK